jgi:uncharacterized protein
MKKTALITGASSGIGLELAKLFATDDYDLVLVARSEEKLNNLAEEINREYTVHCAVIATDLSFPRSPREIWEELDEKKIQVDVLVNNAGFGTHGKFAELDLERELNMIDLNVHALTELTGLFLPSMIEKGSGKILNVASTAAFQPGPLMATYFASKAFVLNFSEALANEVKGTGVTVTCLCPGATKTNFESTSGNSNLFAKTTLATAESVATEAYSALMKGKTTIITGWKNNVLIFLNRFAPRKVVTHVVRNMME